MVNYELNPLSIGDIEFSDMRSAYGDSLVDLGGKNANIVCVGGDTTDSLKTKNSVKNILIDSSMLEYPKRI